MGAYFFYSNYIYDDGTWTAKCLQIKDGKFTRNVDSLQKVQEMDVTNFWVGPGKVYVDKENPLYYNNDYSSIVNKFIYRGCTLLLCQLPVHSKTGHKSAFSQFKKKLSLLPIDHMIVPRIPIRLLAHDHILFFGRMKLPFIVIESDTLDDLLKVKWEWIGQVQSFSKIPLVIDILDRKEDRKQIQSFSNQLKKFFQINIISEGISTEPLSKQTLRLTGISPFKGELIQNGCADYNLFGLDKIPSIDEQSNFSYHKTIPLITVMNGEVIKSNHLVEEKKGNGTYKSISIPNHFVPS